MKISVITASRYGSTDQAGNWIAERLSLAGCEVDVLKSVSAVAPCDEDVVIMGSGLYAHKMLPEMDKFIDRHLPILARKKIALFATAMRPEPVFVRGSVHGGLSHLKYLFEKLGDSVIHAEMLGGQMTFDALNDEDKLGLERFYQMLKLTPQEITERKKPRTLMVKSDYWKFAEDVLARTAKV